MNSISEEHVLKRAYFIYISGRAPTLDEKEIYYTARGIEELIRYRVSERLKKMRMDILNTNKTDEQLYNEAYKIENNIYNENSKQHIYKIVRNNVDIDSLKTREEVLQYLNDTNYIVEKVYNNNAYDVYQIEENWQKI